MDKNTSWKNHWKGTVLTSLPDTFSSNYSGSIKQHWYSILAEQSNNAILLDVACGNLPIPIICSEYSRLYNKDFSIFACDLAYIDKKTVQTHFPQFTKDIDAINICAEVDTCSLPFEDNAFDLVTSMYGFEYSHISSAITEIYRVVKDKGRMEFVCHSENSLIIEKNKHISAVLTAIERSSFFDIMYGFSHSFGVVEKKTDMAKLKHNAEAEYYRNKINMVLSDFYHAFGLIVKDTNINLFIEYYFSQLVGSDQTQRCALVDSFKEETQLYQQRLESLFNAQLTDERLSRLKQLCKKLNIKVNHIGDFLYDSKNIGYQISLVKS